MELDLDRLAAAGGGGVQAPRISTFPVATQDVALIVDASVPAASVEAALRKGSRRTAGVPAAVRRVHR